MVDVPAGDVSSFVDAYAADADVASVDRDRTRDAEAAPSDPAYGDQWSLPQIGWDQVYGSAQPAGFATLAVLDTGVAPISDLSGHLMPGWSAFGSDPNGDPNGHGTWLSSIAAADTNNAEGIAGVAYDGVKIMPVQVLDASGQGQDSDIIAGLVWAVDHGANVVLMGFSNPGFSDALQAAVDYAWSQGVVLVAATGNDGSSSPTYPAGDAEVVGVSATDQTDALWSGSNYGADTFLAAPGVSIPADDVGGGRTSVTGTSAAAAHVAAAAALLKSVDPSASNGVIVGRLARNADPAGTTDQTGNGRLNLARAITDMSTEEVVPAGAPGGGPIIGPYQASARNWVLTFAGSGSGSVTITPNTGTVNAPTTCGGTGTNASSQTVTSTCSPNITTSDNGATVTFSATAASGSSFGGWSGQANLSSSTCSGTTNPCSAVMGANAALTVTFNALRPTTTGVSCTPASVVFNEATTCTAIVTDTGSGTKSDPTGTVNFTRSGPGTGTFSGGGSCTLVSDGNPLTFTSSCSVTYTPTSGDGTHIITGSYGGSSTHDSSNGSANLSVTERSTSTSVDCPASLAINQGGTCTATVTDTDSGMKSDPTGSVDFTRSGAGTGTFSGGGSCTLVSDGNALTFTSSCSVTYTPTSGAGTHTVRADYNEASSALHATSFGTDDITVTKRTTTTTVDCVPATVAINQGTVCTATVEDTDAGTKSDPSGNVNFTRLGAGTGTFSSSFCTLVSDGNAATFTSSCQVTYTPTSGAGIHTINGAYQGSPTHAVSNDDFDIAVNLRSTSTSLSCVPPVQQVGQNITCTATVTDTDPSGSKSDPSGTVNFARNGSAAGSCTLVSDGNPATFTSSCSVTYSSSVATVDDIVATYGGSTVHAGSTSDTVFIVFYDANAGFVTGGGWIMSPPGACQRTIACVGAVGRANFGFVSKYQKGATVPTGNTEFQFQAGDLNFKSTSYDWLVVSGSGASKAQYKGSGTINGAGDYGFMLTATDGDNLNPKQPDRFRIKIWDKVTGLVVYDNQMGSADNADPSTALSGGSIVIHK